MKVPPFAFRRRIKKLVIFEKRVVGLTQASLARFVARASKAARLHGSVNVLITSSAEMKLLNRQFRDKDEATDVLSFPMADQAVRRPGRNATRTAEVAGEIAISADMAAKNARALGHAPGVEIKILALHGILHLRGYDHERDRGQMARLEEKLRRQLHLPTGLIERVKSPTEPSGRRRG